MPRLEKFKCWRLQIVCRRYIYVCTCDDDCKVKAVCLPEMKKDHLYSVTITIGITSCNVKKAECSCPAGNGPMGSCKHIAAVCFCLEDFVKSRNATLDSGEQMCTSMLQLPLLVTVPRSVQCRVRDKLFKMPLPPTYEVLQELGKEFIDAITPNSEQRTNIEKKTCTQAICARWHEERFCRLTASKFGAVIKHKSNHQKLAYSLLENKVLSTVQAIRWGREHETVASALR